MDRDVLECSLDLARLADPMKDVLTCEHGRMRFGGIDVATMAETTPTPFFLFSAAQIDHDIAALRGAFRAYHPRTRVFYAGKACSNLWFLDRVRRTGIDIEVSSGGELWKARKAGFEPRQIGFNGNAKTRAEVAAALQPPSRRSSWIRCPSCAASPTWPPTSACRRASRCASTSTWPARRTLGCAPARGPRPAST